MAIGYYGGENIKYCQISNEGEPEKEGMRGRARVAVNDDYYRLILLSAAFAKNENWIIHPTEIINNHWNSNGNL